MTNSLHTLGSVRVNQITTRNPIFLHPILFQCKVSIARLFRLQMRRRQFPGAAPAFHSQLLRHRFWHPVLLNVCVTETDSKPLRRKRLMCFSFCCFHSVSPWFLPPFLFTSFLSLICIARGPPHLCPTSRGKRTTQMPACHSQCSAVVLWSERRWDKAQIMWVVVLSAAADEVSGTETAEFTSPKQKSLYTVLASCLLAAGLSVCLYRDTYRLLSAVCLGLSAGTESTSCCHPTPPPTHDSDSRTFRSDTFVKVKDSRTINMHERL